MGHGIEWDDRMFSVREVPWHQLANCTILDDAPDSETALIKSGLNSAVDKRPLQLASGAPVPGYWATVRATDEKVLGVVRGRYQILQNREAFAWTDALLRNYGVVYETAGSLFGGKQIWLLARMPESLRLLGDEVQTYVLLTNRHDGLGAVTAAVVPVRVVCQNTLNLALSRAHRTWTTRHTGSMTAKLEEAQRTLELTTRYTAELQNMAESLAKINIPTNAWQGIVQELLPISDNVPSVGVVRRIEERRQELYDGILAPDLDNFRWTGWGAINAVADFADHTPPVRVTDGWRDTRFVDVTSGHKMVDAALQLVLAK